MGNCFGKKYKKELVDPLLYSVEPQVINNHYESDETDYDTIDQYYSIEMEERYHKCYTTPVTVHIIDKVTENSVEFEEAQREFEEAQREFEEAQREYDIYSSGDYEDSNDNLHITPTNSMKILQSCQYYNNWRDY